MGGGSMKVIVARNVHGLGLTLLRHDSTEHLTQFVKRSALERYRIPLTLQRGDVITLPHKLATWVNWEPAVRLEGSLIRVGNKGVQGENVIWRCADGKVLAINTGHILSALDVVDRDFILVTPFGIDRSEVFDAARFPKPKPEPDMNFLIQFMENNDEG
jgi:hypothetical protein